jgi:hypothetical protein
VAGESMNELDSLLRDGYRFVTYEDKIPGVEGNIHVQTFKFPHGLAKDKTLIGSGKNVEEAFVDLFSVDIRKELAQ